MRLSLKQSDGSTTELRFQKGPIYIGRQMGCQVLLPDRLVSRQHAILYTEKNGDWVLEDLESANKTFVNGNAIHKCGIKDDDIVRISNFSIRIHMDQETKVTKRIPQSIHMDETLFAAKHDLHVEVRQISSRNAAAIKMPIKRAKDFAKATTAICQTGNLKMLQRELLDILLAQFSALDVWVGLRRAADDPMEYEGGRKITSESAKLNNLVGYKYIAQAIEKRKYMLIPELPREITLEGFRSAIIAPILRGGDCFGILYAENSTKHEHYVVADLDYLILVSIHTAAVMEIL